MGLGRRSTKIYRAVCEFPFRERTRTRTPGAYDFGDKTGDSRGNNESDSDIANDHELGTPNAQQKALASCQTFISILKISQA